MTSTNSKINFGYVALRHTRTKPEPAGQPRTGRLITQKVEIHEAEQYRIVNLNSCFGFPHHPGGRVSARIRREYESALNRGTFPIELENRLSDRLQGLPEKPANILMCHHHPVEHQHRSYFQDGYGPMVRGGELVELLESMYECGRWTIVHGHKHIPMLTTGGASANSPIILCAASLGGRLWHPIVTVTRNQFHLLEYELAPTRGLARTRGSIESYSWGFGAGWMPARDMSGLPASCGFGMSVDPRDLAERISSLVNDSPAGFIRMPELRIAAPELMYQAPRDADLMDRLLEIRGMVLHRNRRGQLLEVAKEAVDL